MTGRNHPAAPPPVPTEAPRTPSVARDGRRPAPPLDDLVAGIRLLVLDFDGVLTDDTVYVDEEGTEMVRCSRRDGFGIARLAALGIPTLILSSEVNPVVSVRARKLGVPCVQGVSDKSIALDRILEERGLEAREVCFVGNDVNDLAVLGRVGLPVVVADAHAEVLDHARLRTRARGGRGAVREVCDLLAATHTRIRGRG